MRRLFHSLLIGSLSAVLLAACNNTPSSPAAPATPSEQAPKISARYQSAQWRELPDWPGANLAANWSAWLQSCSKLRDKPGWNAICAEARTRPPATADAMRDFFERNFTPLRIETGAGERSGLITGYYDVLLSGGRNYKPGRVPLYSVPADLLTVELDQQYPELKGMRLRGRLQGQRVVPYWDRGDIDAGKAKLDKNVIAWADDPLDALFLQVQGSGRVALDDGSVLRIGYADQNGHPYRAIGKWLVEQGELPLAEVTMQSIRAWAKKNPARVQELIESNPSYVFFRVLPPENRGTIGALNVALTAGASIAVDPRFIPLGSPVYLATTTPDDNRPLQRLVYAQDTGGAIRGPVRADLFWGSDKSAAELAGRMKQSGELWLLWPKTLPPPTPPAINAK